MAVNPLEGLKKVAANHQLDSSFTEETQVQEPGAASSPASVHRHRQNTCCTSSSSSHGPRVWSKCGSRTNPCTSCWSVVQSRSLRSQHSPQNAARERNRVRSLREAFHSLQAALPSVPPDTKLSKLDVLVLATNYIAHLTETLDQGGMLAENTLPSRCDGYLHPVKKWPMRSLLYCGSIGELLSGGLANQTRPSARDGTQPLTQPPIIEEAEKE